MIERVGVASAVESNARSRRVRAGLTFVRIVSIKVRRKLQYRRSLYRLDSQNDGGANN